MQDPGTPAQCAEAWLTAMLDKCTEVDGVSSAMTVEVWAQIGGMTCAEHGLVSSSHALQLNASAFSSIVMCSVCRIFSFLVALKLPTITLKERILRVFHWFGDVPPLGLGFSLH